MVKDMSKKNHLLIGRGIFIIIIIVAFGLIILNEKGDLFFKEKANQRINQYIEENFQELSNSIDQEEITYKNNLFQKKIISKKNKNLYFYVQYKNKTIKDTYKKDFQEGESLFGYLNSKLEKEIKKKTNINCKIKPTQKLNHYSEKVQERILKEENLLSLKYYYLKTEVPIDNWNKDEVLKKIETIINKTIDHNITPKYYEITITNSKEITTSIQISNITQDFINLDNKDIIIEDILNNKNTNQIKEQKIKFKYEN